MHNTELIILKLAHSQSTFRNVTVVVTTVIRKSPCNPTTFCSKCLRDKDAMWNLLSGHNKTKIFLQGRFSLQDDFNDDGCGDHQNMSEYGLTEDFITIKFKLCVC